MALTSKPSQALHAFWSPAWEQEKPSHHVGHVRGFEGAAARYRLTALTLSLIFWRIKQLQELAGCALHIFETGESPSAIRLPGPVTFSATRSNGTTIRALSDQALMA